MGFEMNIKKLNDKAIVPTYGSAAAAGADLYACEGGEVTIGAGETKLIHTGIAMAIPEGLVGLIYARSGLASKRGLAPANKVGVIDSDYRGEIMVALHNHSDKAETIADGERIAQIVFTPFMAASFSVAHLEYVLDWVHPIIRIMPNTPVSVGEGMILYTVNDAVAEADIAEFCDAFSAAGKMDRMDEEDFNVAGIISGCGPAFMFMFIKAMEEVGKELRLSPEKARLYAEQTMLGAAKLALESGMDPDILKKNVCSPGGTTIEGVKSFEANELNRIVRDALIASFVRTKELARELL